MVTPTESERTMPDLNFPRYTTELVPTMPLPHAAPTPPLPHAAPAPAAGAGPTVADVAAALKMASDERARAEAAEAERDRLSAELAAVRGAWEEVSRAANKIQDWDGTRLGDAMEAMDAALATATPTPTSAEAGTVGERRFSSGAQVMRHYGADHEPPPPVVEYDRETGAVALRKPAALDTPQEADHAAH